MISSDGEDIFPTQGKRTKENQENCIVYCCLCSTADSLVAYAGERFDFVLNANQSDGLFWMRFRGLMDCDERYQKAFQVAVLEYSNSSINVSVVEGGLFIVVRLFFYKLLFVDSTVSDETYKENLQRSIEIGAYPETVPDYENCQRSGRVGVVYPPTKNTY